MSENLTPKEKRAIYRKKYRAENKARLAEVRRKHRLANKEKINRQKRQLYEANKESIAGQNHVNKRRKYYEVNKKEMLKQQVQYRMNNKEKIKLRDSKYYLANREVIYARNRLYVKEHPEQERMRGQKYRSQKLYLEATLTAEEWQKILDDHFHRCHYCSTKSDNLHQEHKIPVVKGGGYTAENIVPACKRCNSSKGAKNYKKFSKGLNQRLQMELF